jgi:hypothetical protein
MLLDRSPLVEDDNQSGAAGQTSRDQNVISQDYHMNILKTPSKGNSIENSLGDQPFKEPIPPMRE